ncbi:glycosyltransferase family 4 protein [Schleiferiaceae bacterium]|jgi:glycosyltransferase involved in cell wall biosynthesis|nr:glycosyltransferase family 4 protein [Schleiferiaceae bacterium]
MKVFWYTRSNLLYQSLLTRKLSQKANGGNSYDFAAAEALRTKGEIFVRKVSVQKNNEKFFRYWHRFNSFRFESDCIHIMEPYPVAFGKPNKKALRIGIIHHIDTQAANKSLKHRIFFYLLIRRLKSLDCVVTVSKVWRDYLLNKGCKRVEIIYNSFNPEDYLFEEADLLLFKKNLGLDKDKKLIYIGNAGNGKGVHKTFYELKDFGYELVMTGAKNDAKELPVKYFNLDALGYRKLIASCDVVLAMSDMVEGWNRIAHEAMLSKVPVIGSGSGGMQELLDEGGQISCYDYSNLGDKVLQALANKAELGGKGHAFVKKLDKRYFIKSWLEIIESMKQSIRKQ